MKTTDENDIEPVAETDSPPLRNGDSKFRNFYFVGTRGIVLDVECPNCNFTVVLKGHKVDEHLTYDFQCPTCKHVITNIWTNALKERDLFNYVSEYLQSIKKLPEKLPAGFGENLTPSDLLHIKAELSKSEQIAKKDVKKDTKKEVKKDVKKDVVENKAQDTVKKIDEDENVRAEVHKVPDTKNWGEWREDDEWFDCYEVRQDSFFRLKD